MESAYFLYNNYPYILAAYGYYKVINNSYDNVKFGVRVYDSVSRTWKTMFPKPLRKDWVSIGNENFQIINPTKKTVIIDDDEDYVKITTWNPD